MTIEIDGVELDYCAEDLGVWFDAGEIEALLQIGQPVLHAQRADERGRRRCPRCDAHLLLHHPVAGLELDVCPRGDGIWFDAGEVEHLARALQQQGERADAVNFAKIFINLQHMLGGKK